LPASRAAAAQTDAGRHTGGGGTDPRDMLPALSFAAINDQIVEAAMNEPDRGIRSLDADTGRPPLLVASCCRSSAGHRAPAGSPRRCRHSPCPHVVGPVRADPGQHVRIAVPGDVWGGHDRPCRPVPVSGLGARPVGLSLPDPRLQPRCVTSCRTTIIAGRRVHSWRRGNLAITWLPGTASEVSRAYCACGVPAPPPLSAATLGIRGHSEEGYHEASPAGGPCRRPSASSRRSPVRVAGRG
jgi:hypothetical protein